MQAETIPLIAAVVTGDIKEVERLLANGADVNAQNSLGMTALMMAAVGGYCRIVDILLAKGADVNAANGAQITALMLACLSKRDDTNIVRVLLQHNADVYAVGGSHQTALMLAFRKGNRKIVALLCQHWMVKNRLAAVCAVMILVVGVVVLAIQPHIVIPVVVMAMGIGFAANAFLSIKPVFCSAAAKDRSPGSQSSASSDPTTETAVRRVESPEMQDSDNAEAKNTSSTP